MDRKTILIVDDARLNIDILKAEFDETYNILVAKNGEQALKRVETNPVDLILLDIMMPGIDGYEVCRRLKDNLNTMNIPVIFITSKSQDEDEEKGLKLGAVDYIRKPFYLPIVKQRVKTHMELKLKSDLLEELASIDGLTSIPNRRRFDEMLEAEWKRSMRSRSFLSLIITDVDHFKQFNDTYGHGAGDECLKRVAKRLQETLSRPTDMVARYGGEEFVALLPDTHVEGAKQLAVKMKEGVQDLNIDHQHSSAAEVVTISLGVATNNPESTLASPKELLETADQRLYQAKEDGRNQVCSD